MQVISYFYTSFSLGYSIKGSCLTSKGREAQMGTGLSAVTQVRKTQIKPREKKTTLLH